MATAPRPASRGRSWQLGLIVGVGAGLAMAYIGRHADRVARRGLVDWDQAAVIAAKRLRRAPGALDPAALVATEPAWNAIMERIVPLLETRLGRRLPGIVERHAVVDRAGWAAANLVTFRSLIERLEPALVGSVGITRPPSASISALANRVIATQQFGFLLGYLGQHVLGQYDVAILSAEAAPGRLLFVEENIRQVARQLDVPLEEMRTW
ncbi:MAG: zinc-dependent metalloprotease, partial [Gaiellales bacterium]